MSPLRSPAPLLLAILLAATTGPGCIATSARLHAGAVAAGDQVGFQAGVALGFGLTTGRRTAVVGHLGFATGTAPKAGLTSAIEYARIPERRGDLPLSLRLGLGGTVALAGDPTLSTVIGGAMVVLRDRSSSSSGHEKLGGGGWSRSVLGVGMEARAGVAFVETAASTPDDLEREARPGGSLSLTVEWINLSQVSFF
jgi:hypothetical protein